MVFQAHRAGAGGLTRRPGVACGAGPVVRTLASVVLVGVLFFGLGPAASGAGAAESAGIEWEAMFGGRAVDRGLTVQQTDDGGFVAVGTTSSDFFVSYGTDYDAYLVKTDAAGRLEWQKTFGGVGDDEGVCVQQTSDGGYVLTGTTRSGTTGTLVYLVKTDASGRLEWQRTFGGGGEDAGRCVRQTADGGFIVLGETDSFGAGESDLYLIRLDSAGKMLWEKTYGGDKAEQAACVQETRDGGFVVSGATASFGAGGFDVYVIKTGAAGKPEWERTFGGSGWDFGSWVRRTGDGGYVIAGATASFGAGGYDAYLIKTGAAGMTEWERTFGGSGWDAGKTVRQTGDGGYLVAGWTDSFSDRGWELYLVRTDASGRKLEETTVAGGRFDERFGIGETGDGGYVVAGWWAEPLRHDQFRNDDAQMYLTRVKAVPGPGVPRIQARHLAVVLDGDPLYGEVRPVIRNGRVLVPYRTVAEALGAAVRWDPARRTVTLAADGVSVELGIGTAAALVNGVEFGLDAPPELVAGRTMVPLRFIGEALGAKVHWDAPAGTVIISWE